MHFLKVAAPLALVSATFAIPLEKRQYDVTDGAILQYALTLEYLEAQFYKEALANYSESDFVAAGFHGVRRDVVEIGAHEEAHVVFLYGKRPRMAKPNLQLHSWLLESLQLSLAITASQQPM